MPKLVAGLLYEAYSNNRGDDSVARACSPYLIFILNFDEIDFRALEINLQWLEETDRRETRQTIKVTMLGAKDLTKRGDLYLKGKYLQSSKSF